MNSAIQPSRPTRAGRIESISLIRAAVLPIRASRGRSDSKRMNWRLRWRSCQKGDSSLEGRAVPSREIGPGPVSVLGEFKNFLARRVLAADVLGHQQENGPLILTRTT